MSTPRWSVGRLMAAVAILAVGLTALLAVCVPQERGDPGMGVLALVVSVLLTVAADRAIFGRRRKGFWLGFTAAGWLCAAGALTYHQESRGYLLRYGPPVARLREDYRRQLAMAAMARENGEDVLVPRPSEWSLLQSLLTETGLGLMVGGLVATAGGLCVAGVAFVARQADRLLAARPGVPYRRGDRPDAG
jgi:hypothetical protein